MIDQHDTATILLFDFLHQIGRSFFNLTFTFSKPVRIIGKFPHFCRIADAKSLAKSLFCVIRYYNWINLWIAKTFLLARCGIKKSIILKFPIFPFSIIAFFIISLCVVAIKIEAGIVKFRSVSVDLVGVKALSIISVLLFPLRCYSGKQNRNHS